MNDHDDLSAVLESNMCIACGACAVADPSLSLVLDPTTLLYQPNGVGNADAADVCPAIAVDFPGLEEQIFGTSGGPYGVVDEVFLAQSTTRERNLAASSGGLIKELLLDYLARPDVDGVIALTEVEGLEFRPEMITGLDQVDTLPGSVYHNVPLTRALEILAQNEGRFVVVAIPCQLEGIYNYVTKKAPQLMERIHTTIGLLCGWTYSHHALKAICEFKGLDYDDLHEVSYRGGGPVGKLRLRDSSKEVAVNRRVDFSYQVAFDRSFNAPRCHTCINHHNMLADLVVGDAWLPSTVTTRTGISLLICRSPETTATVRSMHADGRVRLLDASEEEIKESQTRRVVFGDFAYAYADHRRGLGLHTPEMAGGNKAVTRPAPEKEVAKFHRELERKLALQQQGRYQYLRFRKATVELRRYLWRYLRWFGVRVLKLKSLAGARKEISSSALSDFE